MTNRCIPIVLLLLLFSTSLIAQQQLKGTIYSTLNDSTVSNVTAFNKTQNFSVLAGKNGRYTIAAAEGDSMIFSAIGFLSDTVPVSFGMLITQHDVTLKGKFTLLQTVRVISSYKQDSVDRRNYYKEIYKKQSGITGFNSPEKGVGLTLSPLSFFSKTTKQKRTLRKRLLREEQEDYIDRSFPAVWVAKLTGLIGDSLNLFLYRYRPSHSFCRKTDRQGMVIYINDKLKEFLQRKDD